MKMRFVGQNNSLGFRYGVIYDVSLSINPISKNIQLVALDKITKRIRYCEYSNEVSLLNNWTGVD